MKSLGSIKCIYWLFLTKFCRSFLTFPDWRSRPKSKMTCTESAVFNLRKSDSLFDHKDIYLWLIDEWIRYKTKVYGESKKVQLRKQPDLHNENRHANELLGTGRNRTNSKIWSALNIFCINAPPPPPQFASTQKFSLPFNPFLSPPQPTPSSRRGVTCWCFTHYYNLKSFMKKASFRYSLNLFSWLVEIS